MSHGRFFNFIFMKMRLEFEHVRTIILNRSSSLKLDEILFEFMAKETNLKSVKIRGPLLDTTLLASENIYAL